ncbi:MAG: shikimate kinase [Acidaminococcus sp.]|jgi:shikimate kinase|nr:shikimate kinase [Acidaminococcus sp.]MCI2100094.1 shikimate kinase [Acidaminococcus sp.]MCI2114371.1 shikimate kinase [Acidaminococcus sp.]MCI2116324.1 shikimate kinase [Acidaminococcus sp.]
MRNIVLIGLPGCGKSTIGKKLAQALHRPFYDADITVVEMAGETIADMFAKSEDYFRSRESEAIRALAQKQGIVIACGGGVVTRECNMEALRKTGTVVFLDRSVDDIVASVDTSMRPLLKDGAERVRRLDKQRRPLYQKYSDLVVPVEEPFTKTVNKLAIRFLHKQ